MPKRRSSRRKKGSKRQSGAHPRKNDRRNEQDRFLIVCEGTETEPNYFKSFRVPKKVKGTGLDTTRKIIVRCTNCLIFIKAEPLNVPKSF